MFSNINRKEILQIPDAIKEKYKYDVDFLFTDGITSSVTETSLTPSQLFDVHSTARKKPFKTFYVATSGSDSNDGTEFSAFATIGKAVQEANATKQPCKIYINSGTYDRSNSLIDSSNTPTNDTAFIARNGKVEVGCFDSNVSFSADGTFSDIYVGSRSNVNKVLDLKNVDENGNYVELRYVSTVEICDRTPNSWTNDGGNSSLYINRIDGLQPVAETNTRYLLGGINTVDIDQEVNVYFGNEDGFSGFDFLGGQQVVTVRNQSSSYKTVIFENCSARYGGGATNNGVNGFSIESFWGTTWLFNCDASLNDKDGFNVHNTSGVPTSNMITVNCTGFNNGAVDYSDQSSCNGWTAHEDCLAMDFSGHYKGNSGGSVNSIGTSKNLLVGTKVENARGDRHRSGSLYSSAVVCQNSAEFFCYRVKTDVKATDYSFYTTGNSAVINNHEVYDLLGISGGFGSVNFFDSKGQWLAS